LLEMSKSCRRAIFIDTHVAPEFDDDPAVEIYRLSELTTHEGLPGRWYPEHDLQVATDKAQIESLKWASWENNRSFWPTRGALNHAMRGAGFATVVEDYDQLKGGSVYELSRDGWHAQNSRAMFVGIKSPLEQSEPGPFDAPPHPLNGAARSAAKPAAPDPVPPRDDLAATSDLEAERLRCELDAIYASNSWRLTAPLRMLRTWMARAG
jgi:hypothetical protein